MRSPLKDFFYFSRGERRGIIVLITGIIIVFLSGYFYSYWKKRQPPTEEEIHQQTLAVAECNAFIASIQEKEKHWEKRFSKYNTQSIVLASFDPNTADSTTFRRLGLPGWMAHNILRYRHKGGKFRKAEDFKKIYGLTEEQYHTLSPYISIATEDTDRNVARLYNPPVANDSSVNRIIAPYKYPAGTIIDLNRTDTTELKKIPGIGSGIARLITSYRQRLGGFYRIEQLQDIHLDYHPLQSWFHIDSKDIRLINLNRTGIERLRNHPYINFYQAKAFVEYRKKKGVLQNLKPLALYEEFSETDLERISHYICFE